MSGALTILDDLTAGLDEAAWNGVPFYMPNSRHEVGRRVMRLFFPGSDATAYQDLGAYDGPMRVQGLLIGDRYVHYARQLEAALRTPGAGTLSHPWYGDLTMVLLEPASLTFSAAEQRVLRFEAAFGWYQPNTPPATSWLDALLDAASALVAAVRQWLRQLLAPLAQGIALYRAVSSFLSVAAGYFHGLTGTAGTYGSASGNPAIVAATAAPIAALTVAVPAGAGYGDGVGALVTAVPAAIASTSAQQQPSAVGAGDQVASAARVDGRITMAMLLDASSWAVSTAPATPGGAALALATAASCAACACEAATSIAWDSDQEAQAALARLLAALDGVASMVAAQASAAPGAAGALWSAVQELRAATRADMTAVIGRLPRVRTLTLAAPLPAWRIATIVAGDDVARIRPCYDDLIRRNRVRNPAAVPAGTIEVLDASALPALVPGA